MPPIVRPAPVLWLTGLSGAGKSTIAQATCRALRDQGRAAAVLDGDELRRGLTRDLGFSEADRAENVRRAAEVARLMADAGLVVIVALISPFREDRARARALFEEGRFFEIHIDTALSVAEARDPKGLYRQARQGLLPAFTGISSPYETPLEPALRIDTAQVPVEAAARRLIDLLPPP
ncbi:adenylyl-sulfate kinase [Rubrivivax rivuli]|uniref:adenylyl-sulfate kinase n=1 Tax=Rubrivivax rivuli TaxID=1862385 RepID=UPI0028736606|nr:adenylyl-sulfate kinase [Rubrivivax rivuli]